MQFFVFFLFYARPQVLSGSARNLVCGILMSYRWSWRLARLASAAWARIGRHNGSSDSVRNYGTSGQQPYRIERCRHENYIKRCRREYDWELLLQVLN